LDKQYQKLGLLLPEQLEKVQEKLTELIVRECACIADDMKQIDTAKAIKQHFGVE
jgi:hypothetical protein